jgi:hypothetical protein
MQKVRFSYLQIFNILIHLFSFSCGQEHRRHAGSSTTTNLLNHVKVCTPRSDLRPQQAMMKAFGQGSTYTRQLYRYLCSIWIASCRRPFRITKDEPYQQILQMMNPLVKKHSVRTQARDIKHLFQLSRDKIFYFSR